MSSDELKKTTEQVDVYARGVLPVLRYAHSLRVAALSRELCSRFGLDPARGYLAGIAHDICKAYADRMLIRLAAQDSVPITPIEQDKPSLLHGRAAAVILRTEFGVADGSVLDAVRYHTFGAPGLDDLGKIVFVADKMEPGRTGIDPAFRKRILDADLVEMTRLVLEDNIRYLHAKGKEVSAGSMGMLEELGGRNAKE